MAKNDPYLVEIIPGISVDTRFLVITLEAYYLELIEAAGGKETVSMRTLQRWAENNQLPGAFRHGQQRIWMLNKLVLLQQGAQWTSSGAGTKSKRTENEAPQGLTPSGKRRRRRKNRYELPSSPPEGRMRPLRFG